MPNFFWILNSKPQVLGIAPNKTVRLMNPFAVLNDA
jgi:hypothetical protein